MHVAPGREETLRERPVRGEMEISEENLAFAQQIAFRCERFLDLHDHIRGGKDFLVRRNDFRSGRLIVAVVKPIPAPALVSTKNLMAAFDELVDSGGQQSARGTPVP